MYLTHRRFRSTPVGYPRLAEGGRRQETGREDRLECPTPKSQTERREEQSEDVETARNSVHRGTPSNRRDPSFTKA